MIDVTEAPASPMSEHLFNVYSQFGEDGVLAEIFKRIGPTNQQCFEVGAADGKWFSNSRRLTDLGWKAALIEADPVNWPELDKLDDPPRINVVHGAAEPSGECSLDSILAQCRFDHAMDLGVIDVDSQDYYLWNGMMKFRPRVMVVEYDPNAPTGFVPELNGGGQAGLAAIISVAISKGYFNATTTKTNAIFIVNEERSKFYGEPSVAAAIPPPAPAPARTAPRWDVVHSHNGNDNNQAATPPGGEEMIARANELRAQIAPLLEPAAAGKKEFKVVTILSRPRFGLNCFFDCASEGLAPWHIPLCSFYGVFWGQHMQTAMEKAQRDGIDLILTLDYDTLFTSQHLRLLFDALRDEKIHAVAGLQARRGVPAPLLVCGPGQAPARMSGGPVAVRTAHFGLTLLRVEKLANLPKPWFWSTPDPTGSWGEGRLDDDIYFWGKWGDHGNSLFVHTGCRIGHVEEMVAHYNEKGEIVHSYITQWRKNHGHMIESAE